MRLLARRLSDVTDMSLRKRNCRVIVRNLSFQAAEFNVADKLGKFGPLLEVASPRVTVALTQVMMMMMMMMMMMVMMVIITTACNTVSYCYHLFLNFFRLFYLF